MPERVQFIERLVGYCRAEQIANCLQFHIVGAYSCRRRNFALNFLVFTSGVTRGEHGGMYRRQKRKKYVMYVMEYRAKYSNKIPVGLHFVRFRTIVPSRHKILVTSLVFALANKFVLGFFSEPGPLFCFLLLDTDGNVYPWRLRDKGL